MSAEFVRVAQNDVGLDRTHINAVGQIALVNDSSNKSIVERQATPATATTITIHSTSASPRKLRKPSILAGNPPIRESSPTAPVLAEAKHTLPMLHA